MALIRAFLNNESGATAIEYGLIAAGISIAIIGVVKFHRLIEAELEPLSYGQAPLFQRCGSWP